MPRRIDYDSPAVMAEARRKLAEMYAAEDTAGRTYIGRKLDYTGKPQNIRRSVRRLAQYSLRTGEETSLNQYFKPYTTIEDPNPWLGVIPPYSITGLAQISARVMYLVRRADVGGYTYFETFLGWINTGKFSDIREGFQDFVRRTERLYFDADALRAEGLQGYPGLEAIAFTGEGVEQLLSLPEYEGEVPPREPLENYGIFIYNTRFEYEGQRRLDYVPPTSTGRPFPSRPKGRRKKIIQYINRSYAARKQAGSL